MNAKDVMKNATEMSFFITRGYFQDLSDSELLVRAVPGMNHIAWQLGHLINSTNSMLKSAGGTAVTLPEGFEAAHSKETAASDDPKLFCSAATYLELTDKTKEAIIATIDAFPESKLDDPGPEAMRDYAPTMGAILGIAGSHWMMHAGQFVAVRRKLGKPAMF